MFQRTAQTPDELTAAAAADYKAAREREAEVQQQRTDLLATPLSIKEQVRILQAVIDRSRERFEGELDRRLSVINEPHFDLADRECLDAIEPMCIMGSKPSMVWTDAVNAVFGELIIKHVEMRAKVTGADRSKLTLSKKQAELARLEALQIEYETAAQRALNQWRQQTGSLTGFP